MTAIQLELFSTPEDQPQPIGVLAELAEMDRGDTNRSTRTKRFRTKNKRWNC